jgi:hypothetical protein
MLQKFVQGVQFVLEYEACFGTNRVFREKVTAAIIRKRGKVDLFGFKFRNIYYLLANNNAEIFQCPACYSGFFSHYNFCMNNRLLRLCSFCIRKST